jgi:hypothetical protein
MKDACHHLNIDALRALLSSGVPLPSHATLYSLMRSTRVRAATTVVDFVRCLVHDCKMGWHPTDDKQTPIFESLIHVGMCATLHLGIKTWLDIGAPVQPALILAVDAMDVPCVNLLLDHPNASRPNEIDWTIKNKYGLGWIGRIVNSPQVVRNLGRSAATIMTRLLTLGASPLETDNGHDLLWEVDNISRNYFKRQAAKTGVPRMLTPLYSSMARGCIHLLALGMHPRIGADSSLFQSFRQNPLYDAQVFDHISLSNLMCSTVEHWVNRFYH